MNTDPNRLNPRYHPAQRCAKMSRQFAAFIFSGALLFVLGPASAQSPQTGTGQTLYYIPHTHWEGAVFKTREGYLDMGLPNILKALRLLKSYPDYKFTLDQVAYIKPFLERYPEEAAAFRKFIAEGRLEIVGGMDVMPDDVKPGGELFVRQVQYGKRFCRENLGVDVTVAWFLDTFGHHPQLPQILKLAGYKSFWFCRGVPSDNLPSEFHWQGIDGTEIPAFWLPGFYGLFYGPPRQLPEFSKFFRDRFDSLNAHARGSERVGLAGVDVSEPEDYVPALIQQFNRQPAAPFAIHYAVPSEFAAVVAKRPQPPVIRADFNPIFQGTYSSRIELKQWTRQLEQLLLTAEKLSALAAWRGAASADDMIWRAWEPVLFNQTHDLASGVMTDVVYEDTVRSCAFSQRLAEETIQTAWDSLAGDIDTSGDGIPVVVFNPLGWSRADIAEVEVGVATPGIKGLSLTDAAGNTVPIQVLDADRDADGGLKRARIAFVARDVPAMGYSAYHVVPQPRAFDSEERSNENAESNVMENEFYRVAVNLATGEMTSLFDKASQWEVLARSANVVSRQQDRGDLWELYRGLNGGSYIAMKDQQPVPQPGQAQFSNETAGTNRVVHRGPVFSECAVAHPFANGSFATRVRLYAGLRRIDIETQVVNNEKYVRYQALFPTSIRDGRSFQEIPFGAVERPAGIEFPAQNWVDYGDGRRGIALLNQGLPGNLVTDGTLMLSLMRSENLGHYGFGGGYEPGMSSETGFELGRELTFHYALVPHAGDWRQAAVYRAGMEFNHPLIVRKRAAHAGALSKRWGLLEISNPNVVLTAFKPGPGQTTVLRVYEAAGQAASGVKIKLNHARIAAAHEANLLEDSGDRLKIRNDTVQFDLHPFEIKTIKLELVRAKKRS
ncbi:MAG: alpha-mannosidase [Limisphaerales bacterium]